MRDNLKLFIRKIKNGGAGSPNGHIKQDFHTYEEDINKYLLPRIIIEVDEGKMKRLETSLEAILEMQKEIMKSI